MIELPGRWPSHTSIAAVPPRSVYTAADDVGPVSDESLSIEDVITPEDEAELEDLDEDDGDPEDAQAGVRGVG